MIKVLNTGNFATHLHSSNAKKTLILVAPENNNNSILSLELYKDLSNEYEDINSFFFPYKEVDKGFLIETGIKSFPSLCIFIDAVFKKSITSDITKANLKDIYSKFSEL